MQYKSTAIKSVFIVFISILFLACSSSNKENSNNIGSQKSDATQKPKSVFTDLPQAIFEIRTYDDKRILETGKCFLITNNTIIAPYSLFHSANRAELIPLNGGNKIDVKEFYNYDRINNLILLKVDSLTIKPLKLYGASKVVGLKTTVIGRKLNNRQPLYTGSCLEEQIIEGRKLLNISNKVAKINEGIPILLSNGAVLGMGITQEIMYEQQSFAVPVSEIILLLNKRDKVNNLTEIGSPNAARNSLVKKIILETDYGNIEIKLYNQTPAYRDNFIQLAEEGFYDSLLIHRVIRDFGIQTGAADTRHARPDDIVGWKGPGYTIPAHIVPGLFHKRGVLGSPRKPDDKNKQRRSDGSQFYIVTGRKYLDNELDELEEKNKIMFTAEQRELYKTVGGAPHLDGSYTVFGEVISGLEIADRISLFPVKGDFRPLSNIRINKVEVIY